MNRRHLSCVAVALLMSAFGATLAAAQNRDENSKNSIVGTWLVISSVGVQPDGKRVDNFGGNPKGILMLDRSGHFSLQQMGAARKHFKSNNRLNGTPEENAAAVAGSLTFFGTYTVQDHVINFHIERSSYPNWDGAEQKRPFTLSGDQMKWEVRGNTSGGSGEIVFRRAN